MAAARKYLPPKLALINRAAARKRAAVAIQDRPSSSTCSRPAGHRRCISHAVPLLTAVGFADSIGWQFAGFGTRIQRLVQS